MLRNQRYAPLRVYAASTRQIAVPLTGSAHRCPYELRGQGDILLPPRRRCEYRTSICLFSVCRLKSRFVARRVSCHSHLPLLRHGVRWHGWLWRWTIYLGVGFGAGGGGHVACPGIAARQPVRDLHWWRAAAAARRASG